MPTNMHTRAILVNLSISAWSATKFDKRVSEETNKAHGAASDAGRYNKALLSKADASYQELMKHLRDTRTEHYAQSLAWSDDGWRMLPIANHTPYTGMVRNRFHKAESLLSVFVSDYPSLRDGARQRLNGMFKEEDFPNDIRSKFSWSLDYKPVPDAGDYRVTLSADEMKILVESTENSVKNAFQGAQNDAVKRLFEVVSNMQKTLSNPEKIFRDSLIGNARDLCDVLTRLNIADDIQLEKLRRDTELLATSTDAQTLRDVPEVRKDTADKAQAILDAMTGTYGKELFV